MKTSENIQDIAKALSLAQSSIKPAYKDAVNPHFKCKFSTLASAWESIRIPITSQGLTILQDVTTQDKSCVSVTTRIVHTSGQWMEFGPLCIPSNKQDAQGIGSAISYAKRYSLCAAVGIVATEDDDDAEIAQGRDKPDSVNQPNRSVAFPKPELITNDQAAELRSRFVKCSSEFKQRTLLFCKRFHVTESLESLPKEYYERLSLSITKDIEDNREKTTQLQAQA